jgi:hypothetical protein
MKMSETVNERKKFKWSTDNWISLSAVFIALCALFLSIYEGCSNRKHNRLSVKPLILLDSGLDETGSGFRIRNSGLGPALIKWFSVEIDEKTIPHWKAFMEELGLPSSGFYSYMNPSNKTVFLPGQKEFLFWATGEKDKALRKIKRRITMKVCYCSLYEECWQAFTSTIKNYESSLKCEETPKIKFTQSP